MTTAIVSAVDFDELYARMEWAFYSAQSLDAAYGHLKLTLAIDAVDAVDVAYGDVSEDDGLMRLACYAEALEGALLDAMQDYADASPVCMSWGSSGWSSEAFPKAALGLH